LSFAYDKDGENMEKPHEALYDFLLMGLAWLREDNPDILARRGASVFSCYSHAGVLPRSALQLVEQSHDLMDLVIAHSEVIVGEKKPKKREVRKLIKESKRSNIILASPDVEMEREKLFGPYGYSHVITDIGIEHAMSVMGEYDKLIDMSRFLRGWTKHKTQMSGFAAKKNVQPRSGDGTESSVLPYIPPAKHGEDDFEW
jgi:hypothetical protein